MGLDSVELIYTMEERFGIHLPDAEAATIYTVQDMTHAVAQHLNITLPTREPGLIYFFNAEIIRYAALYRGEALSPSSPLNHWVAHDYDTLTSFLRLPVPRPKRRLWFKLNKSAACAVQDLAEAIAARNHEQLIPTGSWQSVEDVYLVIKDIVATHLGIDYFDIQPDRSFTDDFGID